MANSLDKFRKGVARWSGNIGSAGVADAVVTTVPLASTSGLPTDTAVMITVNRVDANGKKTGNYEGIVGVVSGSNLIDCIRGVEGTAQAWTGGTVVEVLHTASNINELIDGILAEHNQDGTHKDTLVTSLKATGAEINTGTEDAKIVTPKAIADSWLNNGYNSLSRQAIINGNFDVWQRGTSVTDFSTAKYTADRWTSYCANTATTISRQDGTGVSGSQYCIRLQRTVGNTGTDTWTLNHGLETTDSIKFRGKKLTLSFYARAGANYSASSSTVSSTIYSGKGTDQSPWSFTTDTSIGGGSNTITTTWTKFSVTTTNVVASDVTQLRIAFARGSSGTAGAADYCEIAQVQLCAGDVALPFMPKSFEEELRACQRYYYKIKSQTAYATLGGFGYCFSTTVAKIPVVFPVQMRITTAIETRSTASEFTVVDAAAATICSVVPALDPLTTGNTETSLILTVASGLTQHRPCRLESNNNTNSYIAFSAEL